MNEFERIKEHCQNIEGIEKDLKTVEEKLAKLDGYEKAIEEISNQKPVLKHNYDFNKVGEKDLLADYTMSLATFIQRLTSTDNAIVLAVYTKLKEELGGDTAKANLQSAIGLLKSEKSINEHISQRCLERGDGEEAKAYQWHADCFDEPIKAIRKVLEVLKDD